MFACVDIQSEVPRDIAIEHRAEDVRLEIPFRNVTCVYEVGRNLAKRKKAIFHRPYSLSRGYVIFHNNLRAVAFRRNQIKNGRNIVKMKCFCRFFMQIRENKVENLWFSSFLLKFFILSSFPRSAYLCTPLARQPRISSLNPFAPVLSHLGGTKKERGRPKRKTSPLIFMLLNRPKAKPQLMLYTKNQRRHQNPYAKALVLSRTRCSDR